jgi:ketosteroid isomerase-like protein
LTKTRWLLLPLVVVLGAISGPRAESRVASSDQDQILQLEEVWNESHLRGDSASLEKLWADDLTVVVPQMPMFSKADLLAMWKSMKITFTEFSTSDVRVRLYGDTAIVTGHLHRSRDFGGQKRAEDWLFTKAYSRVKGEWKVVAYHASDAPKS